MLCQLEHGKEKAMNLYRFDVTSLKNFGRGNLDSMPKHNSNKVNFLK